MKAYVEIRVEAGVNVPSILSLLKTVSGVRDAFAVTGHTDIVASLEAADLKALADIVTQKVHSIRGIASTETMICVEE